MQFHVSGRGPKPSRVPAPPHRRLDHTRLWPLWSRGVSDRSRPRGRRVPDEVVGAGRTSIGGHRAMPRACPATCVLGEHNDTDPGVHVGWREQPRFPPCGGPAASGCRSVLRVEIRRDDRLECEPLLRDELQFPPLIQQEASLPLQFRGLQRRLTAAFGACDVPAKQADRERHPGCRSGEVQGGPGCRKRPGTQRMGT
jgi:hypothetical protein